MLRPQNDHGVGALELGLNFAGEAGTALQLAVPPQIVAKPLELPGELFCDRKVLPRVAEKDPRHAYPQRTHVV